MSMALQALGFGPKERVVILHSDDIGMCQSSVSAWVEMLDAGIVSSASVMVPCPWFPKLAALCRQNPSVDMGVHLTLTSEWKAYRWGPISTRDTSSGMIDQDGYFFRDPRQLFENISVTAVARELRAQIDRALQAGIDVTHLDSHMFSVIYPALLPVYIEIAQEYELPCLAWKPQGPIFHFTADDAAEIRAIVCKHEGPRLLAFDHAFAIHYDDPENPIPEIKRGIDALKPGLTHYLIHPAKDTPELREMCAHWRHRVADYHAFRDPEVLEYMKASGVRVVGYRALREALRGNLAKR